MVAARCENSRVGTQVQRPRPIRDGESSTANRRNYDPYALTSCVTTSRAAAGSDEAESESGKGGGRNVRLVIIVST